MSVSTISGHCFTDHAFTSLHQSAKQQERKIPLALRKLTDSEGEKRNILSCRWFWSGYAGSDSSDSTIAFLACLINNKDKCELLTSLQTLRPLKTHYSFTFTNHPTNLSGALPNPKGLAFSRSKSWWKRLMPCFVALQSKSGNRAPNLVQRLDWLLLVFVLCGEGVAKSNLFFNANHTKWVFEVIWCRVV